MVQATERMRRLHPPELSVSLIAASTRWRDALAGSGLPP